MTIWKEHDQWKYEIFDLDIEPDLFPGFEDVIELWLKKKGDPPRPAPGHTFPENALDRSA